MVVPDVSDEEILHHQQARAEAEAAGTPLALSRRDSQVRTRVFLCIWRERERERATEREGLRAMIVF